jgi:hypothetical protein
MSMRPAARGGAAGRRFLLNPGTDRRPSLGEGSKTTIGGDRLVGAIDQVTRAVRPPALWPRGDLIAGREQPLGVSRPAGPGIDGQAKARTEVKRMLLWLLLLLLLIIAIGGGIVVSKFLFLVLIVVLVVALVSALGRRTV